MNNVPAWLRYVVVGPNLDGRFDVLVLDEANGESDFVTSGSKEFCDAEAERYNSEEKAKHEGPKP